MNFNDSLPGNEVKIKDSKTRYFDSCHELSDVLLDECFKNSQ